MKIKKALASVISFITFTCATAQVNVQSSKIIYSKDSATWTMEFTVEKGFYVLAPDNIDDGTGFPMKITWTSIPDHLRLVNSVVWPLSNYHGQSSVFTEGDYSVKQVFVITKKKRKSPGMLEGKIHFQGCLEDRCFPPDEALFKTNL
ncbi:hypothetical protein [Pseudobacter ginsenosidimutans]|uniref:Disulfide bond corrector protein DsbC n=1 Tax=Pseudobacter ginsenosidimutans TaxID=661488 RepID=A0A4Q7N3V5_9BACT|nr:hypothetical protein [Pseudobacter ginsenosidimutans]QEC44205.1 hypothetical protein FSB84_21950 [Pseudobacter ginsenosidimutans]RZS75662.1 hypothetical protein EV199_1534 [Pseudobacter ginsenosidimutans]